MTTHKGSAKLTVKVYVNPDTDQQEIRRLVYDDKTSFGINYPDLEARILQVFPHLRGREFKLSWKDPENEVITFSCDHELKDAVQNSSGDILRVFVKVC
ncbi:sequestosome-1-like [Acropora palmata]|uniref:sequestosome-1-like n=1 Tax=Acropora palmata TaxID=6131 RepID=UPI003DA182D5